MAFEDPRWPEERIQQILLDYSPRRQALKLKRRIYARLPKREKPYMLTRCCNPNAFSHNGDLIIKSYSPVLWCPYCQHGNYLERVHT